MGRGLSPQQRAILGAAVAVNAHLNGGAPVARGGVVELPSPERYRVPVLWTIEPPDITLPLAVHLA